MDIENYNGKIINWCTIIKTKRKNKKIYHLVKCNKCGFDSSKICYKCGKELKEYWLDRTHLKNRNCPCCTNRIIVPGINDINTLRPEYIDYFINGDKESRKYGPGSDQSIYAKCPRCGKISYKPIKIEYMVRRASTMCSCCKGISYPERFMECFLKQLSVNYIKEYRPSWNLKSSYDFYFEKDNKKIIIETNGKQHYEKNHPWDNQKISNRDIKKEKIAYENNIDIYINLDCRESNLKWIKNEILKNEYFKTLNLEFIDWKLCDTYLSK